MTKELLKGKGGLDECPKCGGHLQKDEEEYIDNVSKIEWSECEDCETKYSELWICRNWEEIEVDRTNCITVEIPLTTKTK